MVYHHPIYDHILNLTYEKINNIEILACHNVK